MEKDGNGSLVSEDIRKGAFGCVSTSEVLDIVGTSLGDVWKCVGVGFRCWCWYWHESFMRMSCVHEDILCLLGRDMTYTHQSE